MTDNPRGAMFRPIVPHQHSRVTYAELFFDLVFVFAVTQISHTLLAHFTPLGALQVTLLFLAVWWVWVYTSWITNWLNPEKTPVRLLLFAMMLGGLVLSTSIPAAFDGARIVVCHRLCGDAGRQDGLSVGLDAAVAAAGAHECRSASPPGCRCRRSSGSPAGWRKASRGWCFGRSRLSSNIFRRRCGSGFPDMARLPSRTG